MNKIQNFVEKAPQILNDLRDSRPFQAINDYLLYGDNLMIESRLMRAQILQKMDFWQSSRQLLMVIAQDKIEDNPNYGFFCKLLAEQYKFDHQWDKQEEILRRLIALEPDKASHYYNLVLRLIQKGAWREAEDFITRGTACPDAITYEFRHLISYFYLFQGDAARGYELYAPKNDDIIAKIYALSRAKKWQGENEADKTLAVMGVYGLGDVLGYLRFIVDIKQFWAGRLIGFFRKPLIELIRRMAIFDEIYPFGDDEQQSLPFCDYLTFPHHCSYIIKNTAPKSAYLRLDSQKSQYWLGKIAQLSKGKIPIGIAWSRNPTPSEAIYGTNDYTRALNLKDFAPLLYNDKIQVFSLLQGGQGLSNPQYPDFIRASIIDITPEFQTIDDAAHAAMAMNDVISVCTMTINLCGAIGKNARVLLHNDHGYPWGEKNGDHSWYPNIRRHWVDGRGWGALIAEINQEIST